MGHILGARRSCLRGNSHLSGSPLRHDHVVRDVIRRRNRCVYFSRVVVCRPLKVFSFNIFLPCVAKRKEQTLRGLNNNQTI